MVEMCGPGTKKEIDKSCSDEILDEQRDAVDTWV